MLQGIDLAMRLDRYVKLVIFIEAKVVAKYYLQLLLQCHVTDMNTVIRTKRGTK